MILGAFFVLVLVHAGERHAVGRASSGVAGSEDGYAGERPGSSRSLEAETKGDGNANSSSVSSTSTTEGITAAVASDAKENSKEDLFTITSALVVNSGLTFAYVACFMLLRLRLPVIYSFLATSKAGPQQAPVTPPQTLFGWLKPAATIAYTEDLWRYLGLDQALLLELPELCLKISLTVSIPMVLITCPLNRFVGKGTADAPDEISKFGLANVEKGSPVYWMHALIVWVVVVIVCRIIRKAEEQFVEERFDWLADVPEPRATTLLVEGIPDEYRSDEKLKQFYQTCFSKKRIKAAVTVKQTGDLQELIAKLMSLRMKRKKTYFVNTKPDDGERVALKTPNVAECDTTVNFSEEEARLTERIGQERTSLLEQAKSVGGVNTSSGFVTFRSQRCAAAAASTRLTKWTNEFTMSFPPDPKDVMYDHLCKDSDRQLFSNIVGYFFIFVAFWGFLLLVGLIAELKARLNDSMNSMTASHTGWAQTILEGIGPPFLYQLCVGFLPTYFKTVFGAFFVIRSEPYAQSILYTWYFWFLWCFVLMLAVIGSRPADFAHKVAESPLSFPDIIAEGLPKFTNFYINLVILQTSTHALQLVRLMPLLKYLGARSVYGVRDAKLKAEPEDQDYYGIGSRGARWMNTMILGLVFCQIQPVLLIVVAVNFVVCKVTYGYLIVFAETRKSDTGGRMFLQQLFHLHLGILMYIILMTGYLANRGNAIPCPIIGVFSAAELCWASSFYLLYAATKLNNLYWEDLPISECSKHPQKSKRDPTKSYIQPELLADRLDHDPPWDEFETDTFSELEGLGHDEEHCGGGLSSSDDD